tara:strand:+ start:39 stop:605 length:567 start_codon:yes stop_codon:yes gene_type:complete
MRAVEKTPFGVWAAALPAEICDAIVEEGQKLAKQKGTINESGGVDKKIRDGKVAWFSKDNWIDSLFINYIFQTNFLNDWNFNINTSEALQFTQYDVGDFYTWHRDTSIKSEVQRKISITVQLSDYSDYEGGELEVKNCWGDAVANIPVEAKQKGSIIVFPSFLLHQVTPVVSGTRYSLVQWYSGPAFT